MKILNASMLAALVLSIAPAFAGAPAGGNIGKQLAPFTLPWANSSPAGLSYSSAAHPKTVFVLEHYANFCGYCNENAVNVDEMATHYVSNPKVQLIDAGTDTSDREYARWIAEHSPNHPVLKAGSTFIRPLGIQGIPYVTVLDCSLNVVYENEGVWDGGTVSEIESAVDASLTKCGG